MSTLECSCCGSVLHLPEGLREGGAFTCTVCGQQLRNDALARAFRWESLDPYIRKYGASRANLWGGLIGAVAWLPGLAFFMLLRGRLGIGTFLLVAGPYLLLLGVLRATRARRPQMLWLMQLWAGLGLYFLYMAALLVVFTGWYGAVLGDARVSAMLPIALGGGWLLTAMGGTWWYKRRAARLPQAHRAPQGAQAGKDG